MGDTQTTEMNWRIELVSMAVEDVDRSIAFYVEQVGFHLDHDHTVDEKIRFVQITPPGSACSFFLERGIGAMAPGSSQFIQVVIPDADEARRTLLSNGVECSGVDEAAWGRFVYFSDPDGNRWSLQELPARG